MGHSLLSELPSSPVGKTGWPWTEEHFHQNCNRITDPRISIITPSFNQGTVIEETIRSVLLQNYPNFEYIIIDGGSSDDTIRIIRKYQKWIAFWVSEQDRGQAHAFNKGLKKATGKIIGWINSDDVYHPGAFFAVKEAYNRHPHAKLFYSDYDEIDGDSHYLHTVDMAEFNFETLVKGRNLGQPAVLWSSDVHRDIGTLDETLHFALDFEFFLRVFLFYTQQRILDAFVYIPEKIASSRLWRETKTCLHGSEFGEEYKRVLDQFFERDDIPLSIQKLKSHAYCNGLYWRQARLSWRQGDTADARRSLIQMFKAAPTLRKKWQALKRFLVTFKVKQLGKS